MDSQWLHHLLSLYLSLTTTLSKSLLLFSSYLKHFPFIVTIVDRFLSILYVFHGLSPCTVDLDDQTTMHYWTPTHRQFNKPSLVIIHGYGSTSKWQFYRQVGQLSQTFNLYLPGLLFFGDSYTNRADRTEVFQARCVCEGLKRLGVERFSMYAISYGGWVGYRMAEMYPEMVEKVVIVSSGVGLTEEQKEEHLAKVGMDVRDLLCPEKPEHLRSLVNLTMHKSSMGKWLPDFFLNEYIRVRFFLIFFLGTSEYYIRASCMIGKFVRFGEWSLKYTNLFQNSKVKMNTTVSHKIWQLRMYRL